MPVAACVRVLTSSSSSGRGGGDHRDDGKRNVSSLAERKQALGLVPQRGQSHSAARMSHTEDQDHNDAAKESSQGRCTPTLVLQRRQRATRNVLGQQTGIIPEEPEHDDDPADRSNKQKEEPGQDEDDDADAVTNNKLTTVTFVNQDAKAGASCYTGDFGLTSFEEQMRLARQREMQRRKSESAIKIEGGLSLQDRLKRFK